MVADGLGRQIGFGKALHHQIQAVFLGQLVQRGGKAELVEDVAHVLREAIEQGVQVVAHVVRGLGDAGQGELGGVEKRVAADGREHLVQVVILGADGLMARSHRITRGLQHAIEAAQDGEGQDDLAVFVFFVRTAQQLGVLPDQVGKFGHSGGGMIFRVE